MSDAHTQLLADIDAFLVRARMAESTFGLLAVNDGKFVARIRDGGGLTIRTMDRVRSFIAERSADLPADGNDARPFPPAGEAA